MFQAIGNLLGSFLGKPKPGSRAFARQLLAQIGAEAFRLGRRDRPQQYHQPQPYSGDSAIIESHDLMHRRTRDLTRNTPQGKRIRQAFADLIVGSGFQTFAWPFAPEDIFQLVTELEDLEAGEMGPRLQFALESDDRFDEWSNEPKQFDTEKRLSRADAERMLINEVVTVGNGLMVRTFRKKFDTVPLAYQMIERDQLDCSKDRPAGRDSNKIVGGIEYDSDNVRVRYHFLLDHPDEAFGSAFTRRASIAAERVIDLCLYDRPSSSLGISWFDSIGQTVWDDDNYIGAEIRTAALNAAWLLVAKLHDGAKYPNQAWGWESYEDETDEHGNREFHLGNLSVAATIDKEEEIDLVRAERPNPNAGNFLQILDRRKAAGTGLSYFTISQDYQGANFSSTKASKIEEDAYIRTLQNWFGIHVALRMRREFNAIAAALGLFKTVRRSEFLRDWRTFQRFDAIGTGRELLDPYKEGEARNKRLSTKFSTFKLEQARAGRHWIRVLMDLAVEKQVSELFGIKLGGSPPAAAPPPAAASGEAPGGPEEAEESSEAQAEAMAESIARHLAFMQED